MDATFEQLVPPSVDVLLGEANWAPAFASLSELIAHADDEHEWTRLQLALVHAYNDEDWTRGLRDPGRKHRILDAVDATTESGPASLRAVSAFERGMALHIEFVMAVGDAERELAAFTTASTCFEDAGDRAGAAMAKAMIGIHYHVNLLDRPAAVPILREAHTLAVEADATFARSEAARHLGQIRQEEGDLVGALPLLEESLRLRRDMRQPRRDAAALHALAFALLESDAIDTAAKVLQEARVNAETYQSRFMLALIARTEADLELARLLGPGLWRRSHP